jgi:hypothetical protein
MALSLSHNIRLSCEQPCKKLFVCRYFVLLLGVYLLLSGCSAGVLRDARQEFYRGHEEKAAEILAKETRFSKKNDLLFHMERGAILHHLGRYEESIDELLKASSLMGEQGTVSISQQATSLVTSDKVTEYKGEYNERLWVHTYLMMDFLLNKKYENALVEAKQALKVFDVHEESLANDYFSRALVAMCYENLREFNDAYIEYKKLAALLPESQHINRDLYRLAKKLRFTDELQEYKKHISKEDLPLLHGPLTEAVIFVGTGRAPVKVPVDIVLPNAIRISFPRYVDQGYQEHDIEVFDEQGPVFFSSIATDMSRVARAALEERRLQVIAKETARVVAKEALARSVGEEKGPLAESLVRISLFMVGGADIRSWQILPANLSLVRIPLEPGEHALKLISREHSGIRKEIVLPAFTIEEGQRLYFSVRR